MFKSFWWLFVKMSVCVIYIILGIVLDGDKDIRSITDKTSQTSKFCVDKLIPKG